MNVQSTWFRVSFSAFVFVLVSAVAADLLGWFRPHITTEQLLAEVRTSVERLGSYRADLSIEQRRAQGQPSITFSRQWIEGGKRTSAAIKDPRDFIHFEEWTPKRWVHHQAGLGLETRVDLRNSGANDWDRWALTGMPTYGDLAKIILEGRQHQVLGVATLHDTECWQVTFQSAPADTTAVPEYVRQFQKNALGKSWRAWISRKEMTARQAEVLNESGEPVIVFSVRDLNRTITTRPSDWKDINGTLATVKKVNTATCDLASQKSVDAARTPIQAAINTWQKSLYRPGAPGAPGAPP